MVESMRKVAVWVVAISITGLVILMIVMGYGVYLLNERIIYMTAYLTAPCLILLLAGALYLRLGASKCSHCGRTLLTRGAYCPYCGRKIQ